MNGSIPPFVAFLNEWFHAVCKVEKLSVQSPFLQKDTYNPNTPVHVYLPAGSNL